MNRPTNDIQNPNSTPNRESAHEIDLNEELAPAPSISEQLNNPEVFVTVVNAIQDRKITFGNQTESPLRGYSCDLDLILTDGSKVELHGVHYRNREPIDPGRLHATIHRGLHLETASTDGDIISIPLRLSDGTQRVLECDFAAVVPPQGFE